MAHEYATRTQPNTNDRKSIESKIKYSNTTNSRVKALPIIYYRQGILEALISV